MIDFDDALDVGLHGRLLQRAARLRLHFGLELIVLRLLVAFEGDLVDHRVLDHADDQSAADIVDADVGKQAGRIERLQSFVDFGGTEPAARAGTGNRSGWSPASTRRLPSTTIELALCANRDADVAMLSAGGGQKRTADEHAAERERPAQTAHEVPCDPHPSKSSAAAPALGIARFRADFVCFVQHFARTANGTGRPTFPFPSESCPQATVMRWRDAECH